METPKLTSKKLANSQGDAWLVLQEWTVYLGMTTQS